MISESGVGPLQNDRGPRHGDQGVMDSSGGKGSRPLDGLVGSRPQTFFMNPLHKPATFRYSPFGGARPVRSATPSGIRTPSFPPSLANARSLASDTTLPFS